MLTLRRLNEEELEIIIKDAPDSETRNLKRILKGISPYKFFDSLAIEHFGVLNNCRPLYFCCLIPDSEGRKEMWTVVNSDVKEQFSLFKHCKKYLKDWVSRHKEIYATMEKVNDKNILWTQRLGFKIIKDIKGIITLKLEA